MFVFDFGNASGNIKIPRVEWLRCVFWVVSDEEVDHFVLEALDCGVDVVVKPCGLCLLE